MTIYSANANDLAKEQLISIINKQTEVMLEDEKEITALKEREDKLVEALKFYANEFNWGTFREDHLCRIDSRIKNDEDSYGELNDENESVLVKTGGKKAREVLKELGVEL